MKVLDSFIENLYTGEAVEFRRLRVTPVFVREEAEMPYLEFEEALLAHRDQFKCADPELAVAVCFQSALDSFLRLVLFGKLLTKSVTA